MSFDDPVADSQSKSGAVRSLGCVEGLKDSLADLVCHPLARIGKAQPQLVALVLATNRETASLGHRIDGIDYQIDKDLAQLRGTASHVHLVFSIQSHIHIDAGGPRFVLPTGPGNFNCIAQQAGHIEQFEFSRQRLSCESLNSTHGGGSIFGGSDYDAKTANELLVLDAAQDQLRSSKNCRQRIVKVMRYARCQLP